MKYLVLFIVLFSFCCCHKLPHNHINQTLLAQCEFKKGSFWIYKDSLTGILDTFYITERKGWDSRKEDEYYDVITTTIQADTSPDKKGHNFFSLEIERDDLSQITQ